MPRRVDEIFSSAEMGEAFIFIPTIALAECVYLVERERIELDIGFLFSKLRVGGSFIPIDLSLEIVEEIHSIPLIEIHDRIIVATAEILGAKVLTKDEEITEYRLVETIWN
ncbi:MAG: PIN domain-containing protein [Candidatus Bathyarchaeia archaeon]